MKTVLEDLEVRQSDGLLDISMGGAYATIIYNAAGQLMGTMDPRVLHRYDTGLWSTGMYVVRVEGENWFHNLKVWIQ